MKVFHHQPEETMTTGKGRLTNFRLLLWGMAISVALALALVGAFHWRRGSSINRNDPYTRIPFRPGVAYDSLNVSISNTEDEPYLDTSLNLYVGAVLYRVQIGTIRPGETVTRSLHSFTNERGESLDPDAIRISELEVRARFGGYDVHKDFPPPR